jgi:hypothetical protein
MMAGSAGRRVHALNPRTPSQLLVGGGAVHLQEKRPEQFVDSIAAVLSQCLTKWFVRASDLKIAFLQLSYWHTGVSLEHFA